MSELPKVEGFSPYSPIITTQLLTESFISGVAPFGQDLVVLAHMNSTEEAGVRVTSPISHLGSYCPPICLLLVFFVVARFNVFFRILKK